MDPAGTPTPLPKPPLAVVAPTLVAPVSPTGAPTLSQTFIRFVGPALGVIAVIGFAPDALASAGMTMPPAPAVVIAIIAWCKVIAVVVGVPMGIASQGKRVLPAALPLVAAVVLSSSCAHAPSALRITGTTLDAAEVTCEATHAAVIALNEQHRISQSQVEGWNAFLAKFQVVFPDASRIWEGAANNGSATLQQQAEAILQTLLSELDTWRDLVLGIQSGPDGGA